MRGSKQFGLIIGRAARSLIGCQKIEVLLSLWTLIVHLVNIVLKHTFEHHSLFVKLSQILLLFITWLFRILADHITANIELAVKLISSTICVNVNLLHQGLHILLVNFFQV